jgi:hypothetical protein
MRELNVDNNTKARNTSERMKAARLAFKLSRAKTIDGIT